jgi:hypothetical protein
MALGIDAWSEVLELVDDACAISSLVIGPPPSSCV